MRATLESLRIDADVRPLGSDVRTVLARASGYAELIVLGSRADAGRCRASYLAPRTR